MQINVANMDKLKAALEAVNGRAVTHTMHAIDVAVLARQVEKDLEARGIPKNARVGVALDYHPAGPGKAYARKGLYVTTTRIRLVRGPRDWFLVSCAKAEIWADSARRYSLHMTPNAREAAIAHALRDCVA